MVHKPRFRSHFRVDGVALIHEADSIRLEGALLLRLVPLIDGRRSVEEIAALAEGLSPIDVAFGISWLEEQGFVVEAGEPHALQGFADALGVTTLGDRTVRLVRMGNVPIEPLEQSLRALGVRLGDGGLTVVVTDDYLHEDLKRFERPWMPVKPVGTVLWIGPLFDPQPRGCWLCLAERMRPWHLSAPQPSTDSTIRTGLGIAATEILKWVLQGANPTLAGTLVTLDVKTLETARHTFAPVPRCPVCGPNEPAPAPRPLTLSSRAKVLTPDGNDRAATPEDTLRRYAHLISPITGIVDRLTPSLEGTDGLHIVTAGHAEPPGQPRGEGRRSAGRGLTPAQARAAALCEALERYSGFFQGTEPRIEASYRQLGDAAIHPNDCLRISERQYAEREAWNRLGLPYHWLPEPFDEERPAEWVSAWSLTNHDFKWLPAAYCFYGVPLPDGHRFCRADSNGCAAGACLEEAILQGFLEIVERDALALWWYNRAPRPGVRLDGFPQARALREALARLGREVWVLDLTTDLGIPAFVALSREVPPRPGDLILGAGAHLDPAIALTRALTEINQFLPGFLSGRPRQVFSEEPGDAPYLVPDPARPPRTAADLPSLARPDLREEVELCVERARGRGLEVLVIDQTRGEVGLPVARVVIPGMRLFRARFAPGRLYEAPVEMGWLAEPLSEAEMNPVHILI